jgi:hypothetical protein
MKKTILILLLSLSLAGFSQTSEIELESVKARFEKKEFSSEQYQIMGKEWNRLIANFGGYPDFPVNQETKRIEYVFIDTLSGFTKKEIFQRAKEYTAINFGNISSVLHYEDYESGKLILKGFFEDYYTKEVSWWVNPSKELLTKIRCHFTVEITVKDERFKMKITDPMVEHYFYYNYLEHSSQMPLSSLYPITDSDPKGWESRLKELLAVKKGIMNYSKSQLTYILNLRKDNNF